ncbi:MAG: hypothetical protein IPF95_03195 [Flavobacteriales bacterium]|nr:hypothetical protein [Flavobacteriales bacterium]MBK6944552.1 hypothetical protein [Flavobacteriales bacterium]MBK7295533.1 hypothetical protein [Flavobacteriales bacterium]MBP9139254.1 hypothetical protein [Flavobacteriales bacterium]HQV52637.1 hypothetical protein [Flavobacteriales bacterium]
MSNIPISANETKWEQLRNEYPALRTCTYVNTPTCGAMARSSVESAAVELKDLRSGDKHHLSHIPNVLKDFLPPQ